MELDKFLGSILLGGLVIFSFLSLIIYFVATNNTNNYATSPEIEDYTNSINDSLTQAYTDYNSSESAFASSNPSVLSGFIIIDAVSGIWKTLKIVPGQIISLTFGLAKGKLLSDSTFNIVFGTILSIFIITLIVVIVRFIRT